jgi:hypothetical protein
MLSDYLILLDEGGFTDSMIHVFDNFDDFISSGQLLAEKGIISSDTINFVFFLTEENSAEIDEKSEVIVYKGCLFEGFDS